MPFLRPVAAFSVQHDAAVELRSSKTLIGAGASTCDVVLPDRSGVLEVHALLSLSPTKSSGSLVPFSTAAGGTCYLNGREVPQEGARVIHGDRIAFGGPEANAFVFELTGQASRASVDNSTQRSSTRAFRRALDVLRGDREATHQDQTARNLSSSSLPSTSKLKRSHGDAGSSKEAQLSKLLADASSDSVLSEYVEKKLRQRQQQQQQRQSQSLASISGSDSVLLRGGRSMMEPPPSLLSSMSESAASTVASPFKDSILKRLAAAQKDKSLSSSCAFTSTAEKNYAEIEKLRLSQRMRQVNRVLNGDMTFGESYMAEGDSSSSSKSRRRAVHRDEEEDGVDLGESRSPMSRRSSDKRDLTSNNQTEAVSQDEDEDDDDDELPAMMEKSSPPSSLRRSIAVSDQDTARKERQQELKASPVLDQLLESNSSLLQEDDANTAPRLPDEVDGNEGEDSLTDSLPGFSEPIRNAGPSPPSPQMRSIRASRTSVKDTARTTKVGSVDGAELTTTGSRPKTALHQKLIDQAIRQRRLEALAQTFVRWQRGLRAQAQRRLWKAQQLRKVSARLAVLRRGRAFATWKHIADIQGQVISCRLDAFQSRSAARSVRNAWTAWTRFVLTQSRSRLALRVVVVHHIERQVRIAFRRWLECSREQGDAARERLLQRRFELEKDARLNHTAQWHCDRNGREKQRRVLLQWHRTASEGSLMEKRLIHTARQHFERASRERLRWVLVEWRRVASKRLRRCCVIQRLLHRQAGQRLARALATWRLASLRGREEERIARKQMRAADEMKRELEQLNERHKSAQIELDAASNEKLRGLEDEIKHKNAAIKTMETQLKNLHDMERQVKEKDAALKSMEAQLKEHQRHKTQTTAEWTHDLEGFFERAITQCDTQIAITSEELEQLLGLSDQSPEAARFRASQFLVACMLEQKASNTNARAQLQEDFIASLPKLDPGHQSIPDDDFDESQVPKSALFLRDLLQQRVKRLYQLNQSIAKLAAASSGARDSQQIDPVRARHSRFLADVMAQREMQHVHNMTRLLHRACQAHPPPAAKY